MTRNSCEYIRKLPGPATLDEAEKIALRSCRCFYLYVQHSSTGRAENLQKKGDHTAVRFNHVRYLRILIKVGADKIYSEKNKGITLLYQLHWDIKKL